MSVVGGEATPSTVPPGKGRNVKIMIAVIAVVAILVIAAVLYLSMPGNDGGEDQTVPSAPSDLAVQGVTSDFVTFTWQGSSDIGGEPSQFVLSCCGTGPGNITASWSTDPMWSSLSVQKGQFVLGWTYELYVVAVNDAGESEPSNVVVFTALFPPGVMDCSYAWGDGYVNMSWSPPADDGGSPLSGYVLKRTIWCDYTTPPINFTLGTDAREFNDTTALNGITYEYTIHPVNEIGVGYGGGIRVIPGAPAAVSRTLAVAGDHYIHVYWQPPEDGGSPITKFQISRLTEGDWSNPVLFEVSGLVDNFNDTSASNGVGYIYNIYAYNDLGGRGNDWSQGGSYSFPSHDSPPRVWIYPPNDYVVGSRAAYELTLGEAYGGGLTWRINRTVEYVGHGTVLVNETEFCIPYNMTLQNDEFVLRTYAFMGDYDFNRLDADLLGKELLSTKWGSIQTDHWTMADGFGGNIEAWVHDGILVKSRVFSSSIMVSETLLVDTNLTQITGP